MMQYYYLPIEPCRAQVHSLAIKKLTCKEKRKAAKECSEQNGARKKPIFSWSFGKKKYDYMNKAHARKDWKGVAIQVNKKFNFDRKIGLVNRKVNYQIDK